MMNLNNNMMNTAMNSNTDTDILNQLKAGRIQQLQLDLDVADDHIGGSLPMFGKKMASKQIGGEDICIMQMSVIRLSNVVSYDVERRTNTNRCELIGSYKSLEEAAKVVVRVERTVENHMKKVLWAIDRPKISNSINLKVRVLKEHGNIRLTEARTSFLGKRFIILEAYGFRFNYGDDLFGAADALKGLHESEAQYAKELLDALYKKEIKF